MAEYIQPGVGPAEEPDAEYIMPGVGPVPAAETEETPVPVFLYHYQHH